MKHTSTEHGDDGREVWIVVRPRVRAAWMPSTQEVDVKIAFARQAGDEAGHFQLVADRLAALGFDVAGFRQPGSSPLFDYLRSLFDDGRAVRWTLHAGVHRLRGQRELRGVFC